MTARNIPRKTDKTQQILARDIPVGTKTRSGNYEVVGYASKQGDEVIILEDSDGRIECYNVNDIAEWDFHSVKPVLRARDIPIGTWDTEENVRITGYTDPPIHEEEMAWVEDSRGKASTIDVNEYNWDLKPKRKVERPEFWFQYDDVGSKNPDFKVELRNSVFDRNVSRSMLESWIETGISRLDKHPEENHHFIESGDTLLYISRGGSPDDYFVYVGTPRMMGPAYRTQK